MSSIAPDEMKNIPADRWEGWCDTFTNGNRGRLIRILLDDDPDGKVLVDGVELVAVDYDPVGKGNAFIISHGDDENPSAHIVNAPVKLWQGQDVNGVVVTLEIEDKKGTLTITRLI